MIESLPKPPMFVHHYLHTVHVMMTKLVIAKIKANKEKKLFFLLIKKSSF